MLSRVALRNLRTMYYISVALLVLYVFPASNKLISFFMDYEVMTGFTIATIVAVLVAIGTYLIFIKKL